MTREALKAPKRVLRAWSLDIFSAVFRDSAPKARYQNSLGQATGRFRPVGAALGKPIQKG